MDGILTLMGKIGSQLQLFEAALLLSLGEAKKEAKPLGWKKQCIWLTRFESLDEAN